MIIDISQIKPGDIIEVHNKSKYTVRNVNNIGIVYVQDKVNKDFTRHLSFIAEEITAIWNKNKDASKYYSEKETQCNIYARKIAKIEALLNSSYNFNNDKFGPDNATLLEINKIIKTTNYIMNRYY